MSSLELNPVAAPSLTPHRDPTTLNSPLLLGPHQVIRGSGIIRQCGKSLQTLGQRPFILGGKRALTLATPPLQEALRQVWTPAVVSECSEARLDQLCHEGKNQRSDYVIAMGGGKALDAGKLVAHRLGLPVVTLPTTGATCAAWTALANVYTPEGGFLYDVPLRQAPALLILDYDLVLTAPARTLVAGIGDALAKWYEASVSSGQSEQTLVIAAVQQARVLRDLLLQRSRLALDQPGSAVWREVVDATILLAGVIGGLGGSQCRTVAAHAIHNGLTHLPETQGWLHGEKVAYGILVQLRLEELVGGSQLAVTARQQLTQFYQTLGLPCQLADLGLGDISLTRLRQAAEFACLPDSDLHHLPFAVTVSDVLAAMVSL